MLVEERAALLTQLFVRRIRLTDSGKEIHGALVRQETQEPHKLTKWPEVDAIKGKKAFSSCRYFTHFTRFSKAAERWHSRPEDGVRRRGRVRGRIQHWPGFM